MHRKRPDPVVTFHESMKRASRTTVKLRESAEKETLRGEWAVEPTTGEVTTPRAVTGGISLASVPHVLRRREELASLPLDGRDGFLLSLIDDATSVQTLIDVAAIAPSEVVAILQRLVALGVIDLH